MRNGVNDMKKIVEILITLSIVAINVAPLFEEHPTRDHTVEQYIDLPDEPEQGTAPTVTSYKTIVLIATLFKRTVPVRVKSLRILAVRPTIHAVAFRRSALRSSGIPTYRI